MQIFKILKILSSSKEEQVNYLTNLGTFPSTDELAIEFDDAYKVLVFDTNSAFNLEILNKLKEIDTIFDKMSNEETNTFWNVSSLDSQEWNKIRILAGDALEYSTHL